MEPCPPSHSPGDRGFTLIEVIVGLALLALTAAMLAGIVTGSRQVFRLLAANEAVNSIVPVQNYLRAALTHITAGPEQSDASQLMPVGLTGRPDRLAFSTTYAQHGAYEGVYRVELSLRPSPGIPATFDLVVTQALLRPLAPAAQSMLDLKRQTVVLSNVTELKINYFGKAEAQDDSLDWFESWQPVDRLPVLVRISVGFARNDPRVWQPLDIRLNVAN